MSRSTDSDGRRLTPRRMEILTAIRDYQRKHGYSPTMQELAKKFGVSKVTIFEHIEALVEEGLLRRMPRKARSLEIGPAAAFPDERPTRLPILGRIAAGAPIEAVQEQEAMDLETVFASRPNTYVLQVRGDSMIDEQIRDGDYVVVEPREVVRNGETVVALLDEGEVTLKKLYREENRIRLQPANARFDPIYVDKVQIQGVVVGLVRKL